MLCFKEFERKQHLQRHVEGHHVKHGSCDSTKQRRLALNLWRQSAYNASMAHLLGDAREDADNHLANAARLIKESVSLSPSWPARKSTLVHRSQWDRDITLVLDSTAQQPLAHYILSVDVPLLASHRVSTFRCTDAFLRDFLVALLEPGVNGAAETLRSKMDAANNMYLPRRNDFFLTLTEEVLTTETCKRMLSTARQAARTEVLCFDGSFEALLNVLYQTPWGQMREADKEPGGAKYTIGSLLCPTGVLDCKCAKTEKEALLQTLTVLPRRDCKVFFTDRPSDFDGDPDIDAALDSPVHAQDPMHMAIRVEGASGEKVTTLSVMIRRIMVPLGLRVGDGQEPFRKRMRTLPSGSLLPAAVNAMTARRRSKLTQGIEMRDFPQ